MTHSFPTRRSSDLATDQEATLVEIETALMLRHRIERCALHHDQLGRLVVEAAQRPIELVPVIAVDEHKILANRNEIHRIDALACPRDRKSVVLGKSVSVRVDLGGRRVIKKKTNDKIQREDRNN